MKSESIEMHTILGFISRHEISIIPSIFEGKISPSKLLQIDTKIEELQQQKNVSTIEKWVSFISGMDGALSDIFTNHVLNN